MAASYTSTCYLIDISPSMSNPLDLGGVTKSRLEWALEFVKTKLAQRLINPKATDVTAVVTFGGAETNNSLAADPDKDGYDCIQELLPMRPPTLDDLHRVADIEVGTENVDIIAALYVAGELLRNSGAKRKDTKKVIVLITDCDEPKAEGDGGAILIDWEDEDWTTPLLQGIIPGLNGSRKGEPREYFTLGVIGTDFGDGVEEQYRSSWSAQKKRNVKGLVALIDKINTSAGSLAPRAIFGCLESAIEGAGSPNVPAVNTTRKHLSLILGDKDEYPDESLVIPIQAQKAVQKATNKSMGKMRRGAWNKSLKDGTGGSRNSKDRMKGKKRRTREDSDEEDDEEDEEDDEEDRTTYHAPGTVITQKQYYYTYRAAPKPSKPTDADGKTGNDGGSDSDDDSSSDEAAKMQNSEASRMLETDEYLSKAYKYGADLVPINPEEEKEFYQFPAGAPGMLIRGFIDEKEFHAEWVLNDSYWIWADKGQTANLQFSALLWGMKESKRYALVRLLLPTSGASAPQPRICILIPRVGEDAVKEGTELALCVQMPFKEDVANWSFPSLDRIHTTTGRPVKEHRLLPRENLLNAMDDFVDAMMLPTYEVDDGAGGDDSMQVEESGEQAKATEPWFSPEAAYNPSIHNMRNVMIKKILDPDAKFDNETVPESIARYMMLPPEIEESAAPAAEALRIAADLKKVPPKPKNPRNKEAKKRLAQKTTTSAIDDIFGPGEDGGDGNDRGPYATHDDEESQSMYRRPATGGMSQSQSQYQSPGGVKSSGPSPLRNSEGEQNGKGNKGKGKKKERSSSDESATEGSETEASDVDESDNGKGGTKGRSGSPALDSDRKGKGKQKPVGIISKEQPLQDFEKNLQQEAMISLALEGMAQIIPDLVQESDSIIKPLKCLKRLRQACFDEDEVSLYNDLQRVLKRQLTSPGAVNANFFARIRNEQLGPITHAEAVKNAKKQQAKYGIYTVDENAIEGLSSQEEREFWKT